jgi:hypothetical protein
MIDDRLPPAPIGGLMAMTAVSVGEGTVEFQRQVDRHGVEHLPGLPTRRPMTQRLSLMSRRSAREDDNEKR